MTIRDVAKKAGVCLVTASRVMNGHERVRPHMRKKVLDAARELDYTPNLLAKGLACSSSNIVSVLVSKLNNPYFGLITEKLSLELNNHGISPILCDSPEKNGVLVRSLSAGGTFMISNVDPDMIRDMAEMRPTVGINCVVPEGVDMTSIEIDFSEAYGNLANSALNAGRKKFAFLSPVMPEYQRKKFMTVRKILNEHGLKPLSPINSISYRSVEEIMSFILSENGAVDAVFCENDMIASMLVASIHANIGKFKVRPLVIGCDNTIPLEKVWTVNIDFDELATIAVEAYMGVSRDGESHAKFVIKPEAIIRN